MDNKILPTDEYSTFEDRVYINPTLGVDSTNQFIDNLRNTQQANNAEVNQQTQSLGTDIASNLGGLTGAQSYWTSRYQTPQTNSAVADLRAAAQATALNEALANEKAKWQKRYNDAYNAYQKRSWDKSNNSGSSSGGSGTTGNPTDDGEVEVNPQKTQYSYNSSVKGVENSYTFVDNAGNLHIVDMDTGEETIIPPEAQTDSGSGGAGYSGGGGGGGGGGGR